jgi:hypothetical protein
MTKNQTKKRIEEFLGNIDWMFDLNNYAKNIVYKDEDNDDVNAEIDYDEKYQNITITIYPVFFEQKPETQRKILLHELIHGITLRSKILACDLLDGTHITYEQIKFENEKMTARLENILDGLLRGKYKYAKDAYKDYVKGQNDPKNKN